MKLGRPRKGETRSVDLVCANCGAAFRRKLSQAQSAAPACSKECGRFVKKGGTERRFWAHVDKSDADQCWTWTANKVRGYGHFSIGNKTVKAHRFVLSLLGIVVPAEAVVMHECDNPACVNPSHLRVGTFEQNTQDMHSKGRGPDRRGERHPLSRLSTADVVEIRSNPHGLTQATLAKRYGVSRAQIYRIQVGRNWSHVDV